jgi:hypothetical protein
MASSVSSEQVFSQGRITISKCRSCLKGDIVEALQIVKCAICHDLLFHEVGPPSVEEAELQENDENLDDKLSGDVDSAGEIGWDELLLEPYDARGFRHVVLAHRLGWLVQLSGCLIFFWNLKHV